MIELAAKVCFWLSAAALLYTYVGYALLLAVVSRLRPRAIKRADLTPSITVIITAYNEERDLAAKLENTLALDYDPDKLEVIVASDCSTDRTDEIVREFATRGVRLYRQAERLGKTAAQNAAVELARGEIILFSDATTLYQPDVLRVMVRSFADDSVGCVSGRLIYVDESQSSVGQGARSYWSYETFLKRHESRVGSLIGASGCLYAVRRSAYVPLYSEACSDFLIATKMVEQGLRAIYDPAAVCTEETNKRTDKEMRMRVRIITQTYNDLWRHRSMMNPLRSGFYGVQLFSHKLLRYLVPFFLLLNLAASLALAQHSWFYRLAVLAQLCLYVAGAVSWLLERLGSRSLVLALPQYFVLTNLASLIASYQFLRGERYARWEPIRHPTDAATNSEKSASEGVATAVGREWNAVDESKFDLEVDDVDELQPALEETDSEAPAKDEAFARESRKASHGSDQYLRTDELKFNLGTRTARGAAVTVSSQGFKFFVSMAATAVLARLLTPHDYGLIGMVAIITYFVATFKDLSLSNVTIQRSELSHEQISTLFWINVGLSAASMLLTVAIAPAVAWFYGEPRLTIITIVTAFGYLFGGLTVQHEALLKRQMRFTALAVIALVSLVASLATAISLAWYGAGYWALVFSQLVMGLTNAVSVWLVCRWRPGWPGRFSEVRSMVAFAGNLTTYNVINYFARNLDNLLIGRVWGAQALGLYAKAYQLLLLPMDQINEPITSVAVPVLSRLKETPERYRQVYLRLLEKVAMLTMPGVALMIATADWLVLIVLGPQWIETGRIFVFLGITGLFQAVALTTGWLLITQGRGRDIAKWGWIGGSLTIIFIIAGLPWGPVGVAAAYAIGRVCLVDPLLFWFVGRSGPVRTIDLYRTIAPSTCAAICSLLASLAFRRLSHASDPLLGLLICSAITLGVSLLVLAVIPAGRRALQDVKKSFVLLRGTKQPSGGFVEG